MMVVKDGKVSMMEKDVTLSNGTVIMSNGYYMKKGGTKNDDERRSTHGHFLVIPSPGTLQHHLKQQRL
jgi:hypothetical protein